tara:strand:- start:3008 stop:4177 length:1170 start_codon:yes stop_codon:yes gene_type:complete
MNPMKAHTEPLFPEYEEEKNTLYTTGILPSQTITQLTEKGYVHADIEITDDQIQPASIDLRLGPMAYRIQASFLPGPMAGVMSKLQDWLIAEIDITTPTVFERGCVYIVPLMENMNLPNDIGAKTNPKSTAGRLDIFTRLITDGATEFERVPNGYTGGLYAEIVPRTFPVVLRQGDCLNQLRLSRGKPLSLDSRLQKLDEEEILVYEDGDRPGEASIHNGLRLSINLQGKSDSEVIGYRAKKHAPAIDFRKINQYTPTDFWEVIKNSKNNNLILNPDDFYILGSKEKIRVPPHYAAEMVAYDSSIGEFRIHYAGFFDPGFGYGQSDIKGSHAVLEVRSHDVPFIIEDGQTVGRLIYERLMAPSKKVYGVNIASSYQCQGLSLSKQFRRN